MAKRFTGTVRPGGEHELGSAASWMHRRRRRIFDRSVDDAAAFCVAAIGKILPRLGRSLFSRMALDFETGGGPARCDRG